ncbi:hypothetical protein EUX98_g4038 [Antrodiella citrinella]|uniref:Uncharacterized protein n=1 Tax=Antrodiella citrinella TaxID=2447956 RepID=A0A4S4MW34_9APHY|nr:hypothetical protein EUX98_g4038 [Antrodiella citrinella]
MSAATLQNLEISAIVLSSLSGLFGVYFLLFVLALWSTYRKSSVASVRLRWVTIVLFLDLLAHFITRSLQFARARLQDDSDHETLRWDIPLTVVGKYVHIIVSILYVNSPFVSSVTTTFAGLVSDGLLVWRFHVIYERKPWTLYIPGIAVVMNAFLCWSADAQHLEIYFNRPFYENTLLPVTLNITVAWGWFMFFNNTLLTGGILAKIMWINRRYGSSHGRTPSSSLSYSTVLRAIIESASVTWIGLLIYEIASLVPEGHVTTNLDVGFVMLDIIPIFFGISQTLITARLGLNTRDDSKPSSQRIPLANAASFPNSDTSGTAGFPSVVKITTTTLTDVTSYKPANNGDIRQHPNVSHPYGNKGYVI